MRFYIVTMGCPKNEVDSEGMAQLLTAAGHLETEAPVDADCIIVNTCGFIDPAREESLQTLRQVAQGKRGDQLLIAAGCMATRYGQALRRQVPELDGIIGTRHWANIVPLLDSLMHRASRRGHTDLPSEGEGSLVVSFPRRAKNGASAYLKIADGCSAPCAFCAIPLIKGPQQSKAVADIVTEARQLACQGIKEIVLIAQDTTAYGRDRGERDALPALVERITAAVPEVPWLRIMYAYPQHVTERLIEVMAANSHVCHYLDIPLQHGHPAVLRRMGRPNDVRRVRATIDALRGAMPDIALRTAFIVGYPGETEEEFRELLSFMESVCFDKVGIFTYSPEDGTRAAGLPGQVEESIKEERYHRAMQLQQRISLQRNCTQIGRRMNVLVEGVGDGVSVGRSYRDAPEIDGLVLVPGEWELNDFVPVRVTDALEYDLTGVVEASAAREADTPKDLPR